MMQIRELREKAGIKQSELALRMGVAAASVANWESGKFNPETSRLPKLAAILDCGIEDLFSAQ